MDTVLTITQALQFVGLAPCLFVVVFLLSLASANRQAIIPICYFLALACAFALPLIELNPTFAHNSLLVGALLFGESLLVAFSFLLVLQFLQGRIPPPAYWLVLAIPLIGGASLIYASLIQVTETCVAERSCLDAAAMKSLYNIFSSGLVFLLLVYYASRAEGLDNTDPNRKPKYWLIIALILLNVCVLAVDLGKIAGHLTPERALFIATIFRLSFIYLAITSLFRVFYPAMVQGMHAAMPQPEYDPTADLPHAAKIRELLEVTHVYREMRLNRAGLAKLVGINEHHLSRVINRHFDKNFNELVNTYRIEEAKLRLRNEPDQQVTVIGFEVGFNSIASFNRVFKEKVGVSPTEFRGGGSGDKGIGE